MLKRAGLISASCRAEVGTGHVVQAFLLKNTKANSEILIFSSLPSHVVLIIYHFVDLALPDRQKVSVELYKNTIWAKLHLHT